MAEVLVAGGAGFIGAHLTRRLVARGDRVTVLSTGAAPRLPLPDAVEQISLDLRDRVETLKKLGRWRYHKIFNLSGYIDHQPFFKGGRAVLEQHFEALQNLLDTIDHKDLQSFVQVGSSDEYGNAPSPQREDFREDPIAPYSVGKVAATHLVQMLAKTENFPGVIVRLFLTYGPGQDDRRFIPQIIRGCLDKRKFNTSEGNQLRDFCYVDDIVDGLLLASDEKRAIGHVFNLASGTPVAVKDVVAKIVELCGGGDPVYGAVPYRPGENMSLFADVIKAKAVLGWMPKTSLEEGLSKTIESYRESYSARGN